MAPFNMAILILLAASAALAAALTCPCYTATTTWQENACVLVTQACGAKLLTCPVVSVATTLTVPHENPRCSFTPTVTSSIPCPTNCEQVSCPTVTKTATGKFLCERTRQHTSTIDKTLAATSSEGQRDRIISTIKFSPATWWISDSTPIMPTPSGVVSTTFSPAVRWTSVSNPTMPTPSNVKTTTFSPAVWWTSMSNPTFDTCATTVSTTFSPIETASTGSNDVVKQGRVIEIML